MNFGAKLKKLRTLRGMSQKELGLACGFPDISAGVRIQQYEAGKMIPKQDLKNKLCEILDVDESALSNIDIESTSDVMQTLFYLEDQYHFNLNCEKDRITIEFNPNNPNMLELASFMRLWKKQKDHLLTGLTTDSEKAMQEYDVWKARFPQSAFSEFDQVSKKLLDYYNDLLEEKDHVRSHEDSLRIQTILLHIKSLLENNVTFKYYFSEESLPGLSFCFNIDDLLAGSELIEDAFSEFYIDMEKIQNLGYHMLIDILYIDDTYYVRFRLDGPDLDRFIYPLDMIIDYCQKEAGMSAHAKKMWQNQFDEIMGKSIYAFPCKQ